jgi:hypothetical protein
MSTIEIPLEPNVSIADLQEAQSAGFSVMRSAHVGNARGYNLALAQAGIDMLLVDHTVVIQTPEDNEQLPKGVYGDRNYLPGSRVTREGIEPLAVNTLGGLSLKTQVTCPDTGRPNIPLVDFHTAKLQEAFPNTSIQTNTEYIRTEEAIAQTIIDVALATQPELFRRAVESDGTVRVAENGASFAHLAKSYGILQLNDDPSTERGVLIPNDVDIAINFVIEALRSQRDTQYHISGPDMKHYTRSDEFQKRLTKLYQDIRSQTDFGNQLPEELTVKLVLGDEARFVTTSNRAGIVGAIFEALEARSTIAQEKRIFMQSTKGGKPSAEEMKFLQDANRRSKDIDTELKQLVGDADELFTGPKEAPFISQHDVVAEGGLFVPEQNIQLTMTELELVTRQLQKRRDKPS